MEIGRRITPFFYRGRGLRPSHIKNRVCRFWLSGQCNRNPCRFLHRDCPEPDYLPRRDSVDLKRKRGLDIDVKHSRSKNRFGQYGRFSTCTGSADAEVYRKPRRLNGKKVLMTSPKALPEDIVIDILARLPVKCLMKFQCVCKDWRALVRSPYFADKHFNHPSNEDNYVILINRVTLGEYSRFSFHSYESLRKIAPDMPRFDSPLYISNACNGLVCLWSMHVSDYIYLWNPATREIRRLPSRPFQCPYRYEGVVGLGFDCRTNTHKLACLSFPRLTDDDYHLRSIYDDISATTRGFIDVYNLKSNSWTRVSSEFSIPSNYGTFLEGSYHWPGNLHVRGKSCMIVCFDTSLEVVREMKYPDEVVNHPTDFWDLSSYLMVLDGKLGLLFCKFWHPHGKREETITIWVMTEYGNDSSWVKKCTVGPHSECIRPLAYWSNDELLYDFSTSEPSDSFDLCSVNIGENKSGVARRHGIRTKRLQGLEVAIYKESLVRISPN